MSEELTVSAPSQVVWVETLPVIGERLAALKAEWMAKATAAETLEVSDENLQAVKKERAALRKEFDAVETQRKDALAPVREKIDAFQALYRDCVTDAYNRADAAYKSKIDAIENGLKAACETRLREYYAELCAVNGVDFVPFERTGIRIDMTSARAKTPKKLMDILSGFVAGVRMDVDAISKMPDAAEIMAEYRQSLNMAFAVETVRERRERVAAEREAAKLRQEARERADAAAAKVTEAASGALDAPVTVEMSAAPEPPATAEAPVVADRPAFPPVFAFRLYFDTPEQWNAVKPLLVNLKATLEREGVRYE